MWCKCLLRHLCFMKFLLELHCYYCRRTFQLSGLYNLLSLALPCLAQLGQSSVLLILLMRSDPSQLWQTQDFSDLQIVFTLPSFRLRREVWECWFGHWQTQLPWESDNSVMVRGCPITGICLLNPPDLLWNVRSCLPFEKTPIQWQESTWRLLCWGKNIVEKRL